MTKNNSGLFAFWIFAVYAVIRGLIITAKTIHKWPSMFPDQERLLWQTITFLQIFGPLIFLLLFSVILWRITPRLTNKIFAFDARFTDPTNKTIAIISLILSCIGLYLLVDALAELSKDNCNNLWLFEIPFCATGCKYLYTDDNTKIRRRLWSASSRQGTGYCFAQTAK